MSEQINSEPPKPRAGIDTKDESVNRILDQVQRIDRTKKVFFDDESVVGVFRALGLVADHLVITNYRLFIVRVNESRGDAVVVSEFMGSEIKSVTLQAKSRLFGKRLQYDVLVETAINTKSYATVKPEDAETITRLVEGLKSSSSPPSLLEAQAQLLATEKAKREKAKVEQKQLQKIENEKSRATKRAELNARKEEKKLERQAKSDAKRKAKAALSMARGDLLGKIDIKYVGGYDNQKHTGTLYLYQNRLEYKDVWSEPNMIIEASDITGFVVGGKQETKSRLTVPRILLLGVFSLAVPKRDSVKEASVTVSLKDGRQVLFHTKDYTEYEVHNKLINGISHYSLQRTSNTENSSQPSQLDQADLLEKYAALYKKGILTEEEFNAKKKQLLDL